MNNPYTMYISFKQNFTGFFTNIISFNILIYIGELAIVAYLYIGEGVYTVYNLSPFGG